ncbi:MAG: hypothetical protein U0270_02115 [Labilithrix sp.]
MRSIVRAEMGAVALVIAACVIAACGKKDEVASDAGAAVTGAAPAADAVIVEHVKAHAEGCTVSVEQGQAYSCKAGITDAMTKYVRESKPPAFALTLAGLIRKKEDAKMSATAVALLNEELDYLGEDGKRANATPAAVKEVLAALKENAGNRAARIATPASQLATLAGSFDELYSVADAHPTKEARDNVYRNLLVFGRVKAFPKLKLVAAKPEHRSAALDAVPRMAKATDEEKAAVCPWAKTHLADADLEIAAKAGQDMIFCRDEYIDALLAEAESRLKNKQYKDPFAMVMREPCFEFIKLVTPKAGAAKQCDAVYVFLEKAANDPTVDDATRGMALWNIYYQRRDKQTLDLMRKYENHPNKEISKRAKEAIASLTTTYKLK